MKKISLNKSIALGAFLVLAVSLGRSLAASAQDTNANPLFTEKKVRNYLPHMSWSEVEEALKQTDVVIIPVGSIEQHAKHLPLGTDFYGALETCLLVAQKSEAVVAPVVLAGLSSHHLGFPGTITLTPETFEAVVYETALSLIQHGFRKVLLYNGHGGNTESVAKIIQKINQTTPATALDMEGVYAPPKEPLYPPLAIDAHAGVAETSWALYLFGSLVDRSKVENPVLTFPPAMRQFMEKAKTDPVFAAVWGSMWFRPLETGKKTSTREMTNTGAVTTGDIKTATAERGRQELEGLVAAAAKFIEEWRNK
jgi:creatinine amidohydrolase